MARSHGARWWRVATVVVAVSALLFSDFGLEYFTAQSNVIVIAYLLPAIVTRRRAGGDPPAPRLRGAVTSWVLIAGIGNQVLYGADPFAFPGQVGTATPAMWADLLLHVVVPAMMLIDWIVWRPRIVLRWRDGLVWAAYPLGYVAAMLLRGALAPELEPRYPYPFLDPSTMGWPGPESGFPLVVALMVGLPLVLVAGERLIRAVSGRRSR